MQGKHFGWFYCYICCCTHFLLRVADIICQIGAIFDQGGLGFFLCALLFFWCFSKGRSLIALLKYFIDLKIQKGLFAYVTWCLHSKHCSKRPCQKVFIIFLFQGQGETSVANVMTLKQYCIHTWKKPSQVSIFQKYNFLGQLISCICWPKHMFAVIRKNVYTGLQINVKPIKSYLCTIHIKVS